MNLTTQLTHLTPADQPAAAHQVAQRLFPAYTVDGGTVHLAGCRIEDRMFLRLEFGSGRDKETWYVDDAGESIDSMLLETLGVGRLSPRDKPPRWVESEVERATHAAVDRAAARAVAGGSAELAGVAVLWCKYVEGKLQFTIGGASADLRFAGWARTLTPPPFRCPFSGQQTYRLAATDDGRIVAAEQIQECQYTRRRVLASELETCTSTGRRVVRELMATCPVTAARVMQTAMTTCRTCRQRVAPQGVQRGQCAACRSLRSVEKADPRMARLLDEHPLLDRWRAWRLAETATVYILTARGWLRRLLLVVDKETLQLRLLGEGNRLSAGFRVVEPSQYGYVLRD